MLTSFLLGGTCLLCWPSPGPADRLDRLDGRRRSRPRWSWNTRPAVAVCWGLPMAVAAITMGPGGAVAAGLLGSAWWRQWRARRRNQAELVAAAALAEAVRTMVADLRAGAHPATAAENAAADAPGPAADAMRAIALSARLGGDLGASSGRADGAALDRLSCAWALARRHGLPMAEVLDAVRRDVETGVRFARQIRARMAGPRASAAILAALPGVGIVLGEAMGAHPLAVLATTAAGHALLVIGCGLIWAGTAWSGRITGRAVRP